MKASVRAVYLASDTYLAGRGRQEAQMLGLATAEDPNDLEWRDPRQERRASFDASPSDR
jgi:hypothetical protein